MQRANQSRIAITVDLYLRAFLYRNRGETGKAVLNITLSIIQRHIMSKVNEKRKATFILFMIRQYSGILHYFFSFLILSMTVSILIKGYYVVIWLYSNFINMLHIVPAGFQSCSNIVYCKKFYRIRVIGISLLISYFLCFQSIFCILRGSTYLLNRKRRNVKLQAANPIRFNHDFKVIFGNQKFSFVKD